MRELIHFGLDDLFKVTSVAASAWHVDKYRCLFIRFFSVARDGLALSSVFNHK